MLALNPTANGRCFLCAWQIAYIKCDRSKFGTIEPNPGSLMYHMTTCWCYSIEDSRAARLSLDLLFDEAMEILQLSGGSARAR